MKKRILSLVLMSCMIFATVPMTGCNQSQFDAVLNEVGPAVSTILQIVILVKGGTLNTSLVAKITADTASLKSLYNDFSAANSTDSKTSIEAAIATNFATLNADLGTVFALAQVSDPNTQAKVTALIGLVESAVQIAEAAIPSTKAQAIRPLALNPSSLVDSYNKILVAKTGNAKVDAATPNMEIHIHGWLVRHATAGMLK